MSDNIIQLNQELIHNELKDLVRNSVEETLNALLDHEVEELVNAEKYECSGGRKGFRFGYYSRNFQTTADEVKLKIPKLKGVPF
jgi:transposase-like protein